MKTLEEMKQSYDLAERAPVIQGMLKDEAPLLNWTVKYDKEQWRFEVRGNLIISDIPFNAMCFLSVREYESGRWLEHVAYGIVHSIANLLLKNKTT